MTLDSAFIYKILRDEEWRAFQSAGEFSGSPVDHKDGFIHFSSSEQVAETARKHFADVQQLWLVTVDPKGLSDLKWEPSRGGALFPHLYNNLSISSVTECRCVTRSNGEFDFQ